jgi:hypothetical protein
MLFDVQAALAEILGESTPPAIAAIPAIPSPTNSGNSGNSSLATAGFTSATVLPFAATPSVSPPLRDDGDMFRHGRSVTGQPRLWTGRIVSLDEWRKLTAWERHGPDGRMFCGACREWVMSGSCPHCAGEVQT